MIKILLLSFLLFFISCGGSKSTVLNSAMLIDAKPIAGIKYKCADTQGESNAQGYFFYAPNTSCEFYLGLNKLTATVAMLKDNIITPFELTQSKEAAFELSRVLQSMSYDRDKVLSLDKTAINKLQALDLNNPAMITSQISATGHRAISLENVKKSLSKRYDLTTGFAKTTTSLPPKTPTSPPVMPIPPKTPTSPPVMPIPPKTTPKIQKDPNTCLPGVVNCTKKAQEIKEVRLCLPDEPCDININQQKKAICIPGTSCDIESQLARDSLDTLCLPGKSCPKTLRDNLPGSFQKPKTPTSQPATALDTSINNANTACKPGMICQKPVQSVVKKTKSCLPGMQC